MLHTSSDSYRLLLPAGPLTVLKPTQPTGHTRGGIEAGNEKQ